MIEAVVDIKLVAGPADAIGVLGSGRRARTSIRTPTGQAAM